MYAPVAVPEETQLMDGDGEVSQQIPRAVMVVEETLTVAPRVAVEVPIDACVGEETVGAVWVVVEISEE